MVLGEPRRGLLNPETKRVIAALIGELLGTAFLVFIAVGYQANEEAWQSNFQEANNDLKHSTSYVMSLALSSGLTYMCISVMFARVSGAHFNPALTIAAIVGKRIPGMLGGVYILTQMIGSVCGSAMYNGLSGDRKHGGLGVPKIATEYDTGRIFGVELVATAFVTYVWHSINNPKRTVPHVAYRSETGPMYMGFAYTVAYMLTYRWDGAGLNPIRSFGPAMIANEWTHWWVYWLGPMMGSLAGVLLFELMSFLAPVRVESAKVGPGTNF